MHFISQTLIDDAFLHLSAPLPAELSEYHRGYLAALQDFRRHLGVVLQQKDTTQH